MPRLHPAWWCLKSSFLFQDHFKSAFFYFEGVFYNDTRFPECVDISRSVPLRLSLNIAVNQSWKVFCCLGRFDNLPRMLAKQQGRSWYYGLLTQLIIEPNLLLTTLKLSKQDFWGCDSSIQNQLHFLRIMFYECINSVPISIPTKKNHGNIEI